MLNSRLGYFYYLKDAYISYDTISDESELIVRSNSSGAIASCYHRLYSRSIHRSQYPP